ncbi:MAG TPA: M81 family metallopeptidase [Caulobacteraceae bacterium]|nr:M81 family metallopeptidase [Caulobacteraceae bacterium]
MNVFFAGLATETNSFSSIPTAERAFALGQKRGEAVFADRGMYGEMARALRDLAAAEGGHVSPGLFAFAQPAGPTVQAVYERLRDALLDDLQAAAPVDIVILFLHGAMISQDCWDCEGDILTRVRAIVGPETPIGVVLDPHAHLTETMLEQATVLCFQKEYPHIDGVARLGDAWRICLGVLRGEIAPVRAVHDCRMISFWPTQSGPMRGFVDRMLAREGHDGVLSISFVHGFPWGDTPVTGAKMLVYADGDAAKAAELARTLGQEIWDLREETQIRQLPMAAALDRMGAANTGPLVVADISDNAGGGAPADSTFLARAILERGLKEVGIAILYDPQAVAFCHEVGQGATIDLRIGGKLGPESGQPLDVHGLVRGLAKNATQVGLSGLVSMGDAAWLEVDGVHFILASNRVQCFHPTAFTGLGLDPATLRSIVVKSTNHFRAGFDSMASDVVYVDAPGAIRSDFANIPYQRFKAPFWPKVADPWAET